MATQGLNPKPGPILIVAEEVDDLPDEGYDRFSKEIAAAIGRRHHVLTHFTPSSSRSHWALSRAVVRMQGMWRAARRPDVKRQRPRVVIYASINPTSGPSLLRARLLRAATGAPVIMIVIQPNSTSALGRRVLRLLPPDLLLVGTRAECREAQRLGVAADVISSGVDAQRFKPPGVGEKERLRLAHGLLVEDRIVLHVGHLHESRNLMALAPLAATPGVLVLVVASRRSWPETERLRQELEAHNIRVIQGYQPRLEELYRLADCYVFPSYEASHAIALPLSVLEALSSGLPVVGMRFRALPEQLGDALGVDLVETDEDLIQHVLAALASSPHPEPQATAAFSWDAVASRVLALVESVEARRISAVRMH